jgi:hypothetical protein
METENKDIQENGAAEQPRQPRQRVRISSTQRVGYGERVSYGRSHDRNDEGGFRPEGFGSNLDRDSHSDGYQSRGSY